MVTWVLIADGSVNRFHLLKTKISSRFEELYKYPLRLLSLIPENLRPGNNSKKRKRKKCTEMMFPLVHNNGKKKVEITFKSNYMMMRELTRWDGQQRFQVTNRKIIE